MSHLLDILHINRLFKSFILVLFILLNFTSYTYAQSPAPNPIKQKQDAIKSGSNQEAWLNEAVDSNTVIFLKNLTGGIPDEVLNQQVTSFLPSGVIGSTTGLIASLYNPPASGIEYLAQLKDNFLGKPVYAQGVGFRGLQPILNIWRGFRNIIYLLSSVFFIIIGIMIILRVKISPQAVVTVQNAIPGIIFTLILVTFSYAIAGLLIDLAYFFQSLVLAVIFQSYGPGLAGHLFTDSVFQYNPNFSELSQANLGAVFALLWNATPKASLVLLAAIPGTIIGAIAGTAIPIPVVGNVLGGIIGAAVGGALILLIISIFILIWLVQFFFGLIKNYISIILHIILAPLEIGLGAFPNSKVNFSSWLREIIANLAVFPITIIFLVLANIIIDAGSHGLWQPNLVQSWVINGITYPSGGLISVAIGLATLMLLSKLPSMVPRYIFSLEPSPWGTAIGEATKPVTALGWTGAQYVSDKQKGNYQHRIDQKQVHAPDKIINALFNFIGYASGGKVKRD